MIFIILFQQQQPPNLRPLRVEDELHIAEELQVEEELRVSRGLQPSGLNAAGNNKTGRAGDTFDLKSKIKTSI